MLCKYCGIILMGKNVPERNIIGKVTMFPIIPAVSGFLVTIPTSMPNDAKSIGPKIRKGISQIVSVICAPKAQMPTTTMSRKQNVDKVMYQITLDANHSILVRGVKLSCLKSFVFLYSEDILTRENIGLMSIEKPMSPGIRKSMYVVCSVLTVVGVMPMTGLALGL